MEISKWDALTFLKCHLEEPRLSFGPISLDIDPELIYLCWYCLVLLFLCYLLGSLPLFTGWKTTGGRKCRAKRRRKGGTLTGWSYYQRDTEEKRKLSATEESLLGWKHVITRFRQLLCPDPFCEVCNSATAELIQLLFSEVLEDAPSDSPFTSTATMSVSSFTMSFALPAAPPGDQIPVSLLLPSPPPLSTPLHSPNPLTCLDDFVAPSLGYSLSPEPFPSLGPEFPAGHSSPQHRAFSPVPQYDTQRVDAVLPPHTPLSPNNIVSMDPTLCQDTNALPNLPQTMNAQGSYYFHHPTPTPSVSPPLDSLSVNQSNATSILHKSVPENSSSYSPPGLSVSAVRATEHSSGSVTKCSLWQANATGSFPSTWARCGDLNHDCLAFHSFETSGKVPFLSPDILELLERQVQKRSDFLLSKDKEKNSYAFPKPPRPGYQPNSSGEMLESVADKDDSAVSLPFWSPKDKPQELQMHELPPHLKSLEDHLQQNRIQLFWGLPSLHSESLDSAVYVSRDSPSIFFFNRTSNASTDPEAPELPQPLSLSLPEIQTPVLPQTPPQSPSMPQSQPPADLPCPIPAQPSGPSHQIKICGVFFNRPKNEPDCLKSSDIEFLERHVLQKQLANVWGLPAVVQSSYREFSTSPPNILQRWASLVSKLISSVPRDFPLSDTLCKKLEHHLRKRFIQHRWGWPKRIVDSKSLLMPPELLSEASDLGGNSAPSGSTALQGRSSKTLTVGLSQSGSAHERKSSAMSQFQKDAGRYQGHGPEKVSKDNNLLSPSEKHLRHDSENNHGHMMSLSGKDSRASEGSLHDNEPENDLRVHLSKKFEQINEGRLPNTVQISAHSDKETPQRFAKPHNPVGQDYLSPSVPQDDSLNTTQQLSFMQCSGQNLPEDHIKRFPPSMQQGLPSRVRQSLEIFKEIETASLPSHPYSTNMTTQEDSKSGGFKSISRQSSREENVGITGVGPVQAHPVPAPSHVGRDRKGTVRQPIPAVTHEPAEGAQGMKGGRPSLLPVKPRLSGKSRQTQCLPGTRCPPMPPARQAVATHEPKADRMSFSSRAEMLQGKERCRNLEMLSKASMSRDIFRAEELDAPQSNSSDILITSKPGSPPTAHVKRGTGKSQERLGSHEAVHSPVTCGRTCQKAKVQTCTEPVHRHPLKYRGPCCKMTHAKYSSHAADMAGQTHPTNISHVETAVATERPPPQTAGSQEPKSADLKKKLFGELEILQGNRAPTDAPGQPHDVPISLDNLTFKSSLTHSQGMSSGDMEASQVLQAHLVDSGIRPGQRWGHWNFAHAFKRCQDKNFPPAAKRVSLLGTNTHELGGGDAGLGTSHPRRQSVPTRNVALEEAHWRPTAKMLSQEGQPTPDNFFRKKMKHFLQWIRPGMTGKSQENFQEKGSSISSLQSRGLPESRASFSGMLGAQKIKTGTGKSQERLGSHGAVHSPVTCGRIHQKAKVQTCTEPIHQHPFNYRGPCCKVTHAKSCCQAAIFAGQTHPTNIRCVRDMGGHPQKPVALGEPLMGQKRPPPPHGICTPSKSHLQASSGPRFSNFSHHR